MITESYKETWEHNKLNFKLKMNYSAVSLSSVLFGLALPVSAGSGNIEVSKPNIVLIVADDLGYGDLTCYGNSMIKTPNIDKLASQGVRLTQFYANGPECSPTRTALLTGRYQQRVPGMECALGAGNIGRYDEAKKLSDNHKLGLSPSVSVLPSLLKDIGYTSAIFGKWHLGYEKGFRPLKHGFDFALGPIGYGGDYFHHVEEVDSLNIDDFTGNVSLARNDKQYYSVGYYTYLFTDEAIAWLDQRSDNQPFFLYMPYTAPHAPYQGPADYKTKSVAREDWNAGTKETYTKMVECLDEQVGRIMKKLEEKPFSKNTIVIFISDNGPTRMGDAGKFRGLKGQLFEGGIRVPCIIRWPGKIRQGSISDQISIGMDLTYSILRAAQVPEEKLRDPDGIDIVNHLVNNEPDFQRTLFWRAKRGENILKAVRMENWKLIETSLSGKTEHYLFDISSDPYETTNLYPEQIKKWKQLETKLVNWEKDVDINRITITNK